MIGSVCVPLDERAGHGGKRERMEEFMTVRNAQAKGHPRPAAGRSRRRVPICVIIAAFISMAVPGVSPTQAAGETPLERADIVSALSDLQRGQGHNLPIALEHIAELSSDEVLFVDIRTPPEWHETGVLPNAQLVTFQGEIAFLHELQSLMRVDPRPVVLICRSDNRTRQAAHLLAPHLAVPVVSVEGGMLRVLREAPALAAAPQRQEQCLTC